MSCGFRMCVDGAPPSGRPQEPSGAIANNSFSWAPGNETRTSMSAPRGRSLRWAMRSSRAGSESGSTRLSGSRAGVPAGTRTIAPAQSLPIAESSPKWSPRRTENSSESAPLASPSGKSPSKNARTTSPLGRRSAFTGIEVDRTIEPGRKRASASVL